jgi:hypothetical protein
MPRCDRTAACRGGKARSAVPTRSRLDVRTLRFANAAVLFDDLVLAGQGLTIASGRHRLPTSPPLAGPVRVVEETGYVPELIGQARGNSSAASMTDRRESLAGTTRRRRELRGLFASRTADDAARMNRALFPNFRCSDRVTCIGTESRHPGFSILSLADALRRRPRRHHRLHPHICAMSPG